MCNSSGALFRCEPGRFWLKHCVAALMATPAFRLGNLRRLGTFLVALAAASCGSAEDRPDNLSLDPSSPGDLSCSEGEQRDCSITLTQANGVLSCYQGVQACEAGHFGACENGKKIQQVDPRQNRESRGDLRPPLSLTSAVDCDFNPCDPECQAFIEDPVDITGTSGLGGASSTFSSNTPPDWTTGTGFAPCGHGLCTVGSAVDSQCHACAHRVCQINSACCSDSGGTSWDAGCVALVHSECAGQPAEPPIPENHACLYGAFGLDQARFVNTGSVTGGLVGSNGTGASPHVVVGGAGMQVEGIRSGGNVEVGAGSTASTYGVTAGGSINSSGTIHWRSIGGSRVRAGDDSDPGSGVCCR